MKYVRRLRSGRWILDLLWPDGVRTRTRMPSEDKAAEISIRFQAARIDGTWLDLRHKLNMDSASESVTIKELSARYLSGYVAQNDQSMSKRSRLRIISSIIGTVRADALQPSHIGLLVAKRRLLASNQTINKDLSVLRHMLSWALGQGLICNQPPAIADLKTRQTEMPRVTEDQFDRIFRHLHGGPWCLYTFIRETGCRAGEALNLLHRHVDRERMEVVFVRTKNGRSRRVPMTALALQAIDLMERVNEHVFYNPASRKPWYRCARAWQRARASAGLPGVRVHDLRHAYAIRLAESGCPMHFISAVLGHGSVDFTARRYARFSPDSASSAVRKALEEVSKTAQKWHKHEICGQKEVAENGVSVVM